MVLKNISSIIAGTLVSTSVMAIPNPGDYEKMDNQQLLAVTQSVYRDREFVKDYSHSQGGTHSKQRQILRAEDRDARTFAWSRHLSFKSNVVKADWEKYSWLKRAWLYAEAKRRGTTHFANYCTKHDPTGSIHGIQKDFGDNNGRHYSLPSLKGILCPKWVEDSILLEEPDPYSPYNPENLECRNDPKSLATFLVKYNSEAETHTQYIQGAMHWLTRKYAHKLNQEGQAKVAEFYGRPPAYPGYGDVKVRSYTPDGMNELLTILGFAPIKWPSLREGYDTRTQLWHEAYRWFDGTEESLNGVFARFQQPEALEEKDSSEGEVLERSNISWDTDPRALYLKGEGYALDPAYDPQFDETPEAASAQHVPAPEAASKVPAKRAPAGGVSMLGGANIDLSKVSLKKPSRDN